MKLKVLCVCTMGLNRSKYLAEYLQKKGYDTRYGGIGKIGDEFEENEEIANPLKEEDIKWADIIITAREKHKDKLLLKHSVEGKKLISLEVTDSRRKIGAIHPEYLGMDRALFNEKWTYPQLIKSIELHLPLKK